MGSRLAVQPCPVDKIFFIFRNGNIVEASTGHLRFLFFYLLCGFSAAWAHIWFNPASHLPMIGASGAVSGVLGAYLLLYPRARVLTLILSAFNLLQVPLGTALGIYGFWVLMSDRADELFGVPPRPAGG